MTVAEMIKKTRTEANMTQGEYGAKFGVSRQTVSSWENGRSLPDLQMLIDICNTYHVSLDKLLNEDKEFVEKIDFYNKYKKAIRLVGMCLLAGLLIFAIVFINWKITERNMNQAFEMNAEKLGFVKGELYELEKDNVRYRLPNQKLPFLKKDFHVKNSYADFMIEDIEMSSGCVASINDNTVVKPSQKELELNDILNSKMLNKAKELFDIKKITVKTRS